MKLHKKRKIQNFMPVLHVLFFLCLGIIMAACGGSSGGGDSNGSTSDTTSQCTTNEKYTVVFESTWSSSTHPTNFPADPHFSGLIGATHNDNVRFWAKGETASTGIEVMAETGGKTELTDEISTAISANNAETLLSGNGIGVSPGTVSLQFDISPSFSKVTLVSMIAPSPDWFVGIAGMDFCENGEWVASKSIDLFAYDAGTDSGATYTASDIDTNPKEIITSLTTGVFEVEGTVPKLGTFTFTKN